MKRSVVETVLGAVVLFLAVFFLIFSYNTGNVRQVDGYELLARFSGIGGLATGDDVQISGVKVGSVMGVELDPNSYLAVVHMEIKEGIQIPKDTTALISSESLLGGKYLALEPGADEEMLKPGERIAYTQAPQNLEQLLGKFIFSMQKDDKKGGAEDTASAASDAPAAIDAATPSETPADAEAVSDDAAHP